MKLRSLGITAACSLGFFIACIGAAAIAQSDDDIVKDFHMIYRPVSGNSWRDIVASIKKNLGPDSSKARYEGVTGYDLDMSPADDSCSPTNVTFSLKLTVSVPQLSSNAKLLGDDQACWANYDRTLTDHEEGHVIIAVHDVKALLSDIRAMPAASCGDIRRLVSNRAKALKATQDTYDEVSEHGLKQWQAWQLKQPANPKARELSEKCAIIASSNNDDLNFNN